MTNAVTLASLANSGYLRNRIINGNMQIDQRNAGASVSTASGAAAYTLDRWKIDYSQTSKFTLQQNAGSVTPPIGFLNYLGITSSSAYSVVAGDYFLLSQAIEGFNTADLGFGTANASTITLSFWVRSSLTGTFGGAIQNSAVNRSYPFSYVINSANTWEYKTVTIPGDTTGTWIGATNGIGIQVSFSIGMGSTRSGTANTWQAGNFLAPTGATSVVGTNGATFYITGVQLEVGTQATPFEWRPYPVEFLMCQRYYQQQLNNGSRWLPTMYQESQYLYGVIPLQTFMRVGPTVTAPAASAFDIWGVGAPSAIVIDSVTPERIVPRFTKTSLTNYSAYILSGNGTSYFQMSAEL